MDNSKMIIKEWKSPAGELIIGTCNDKIYLCDWKFRSRRAEIDKRITKYLQTTMEAGDNELIENCINQLNAYFAGKLKTFDLPLGFAGTDFQIRIWKTLLTIPFGKLLSYEKLSLMTGDIKAIRAVASANGANSISIIVPCHRIIGKNGDEVGYAGGIKAKKMLIALESPVKQVSLFDG
jgi:methylated-DNA-[protein]-cysteine S-methyltransferase